MAAGIEGMSTGIIIHGPIGAGKTMTCLELVERAGASGIPVRGVVSPRVYEGETLTGYDCLQVATGDRFPLVRLRGEVKGPGWFDFRNLKYSFSSEGFNCANHVLLEASHRLRPSEVVFVDEFGRLEADGRGLFRGASAVVSSLEEGDVPVFSCRSDLLGVVRRLLGKGVEEIGVVEAEDLEEAWSLVCEGLYKS